MTEDSLASFLAQEYPLISVIVPVYNKASYVEETIRSVATQDYPHLEILIRNDGSSDPSASIIAGIPSKYPNIKIQIFQGENKGASYSRNFLIERASSRIVVLMDADDLMLPGFLRAALDAMRSQGARLVYSDVKLEGARADEWCPPPFDPFGIRYANCLTSLSMLDKTLWSETGGYEPGLPFNEDWSFFIRAAQVSSAFCKLPQKYFVYRQNRQGLYQNYIVDNWSLNLAAVMLASPEYYQVDEIMQAFTALRAMPVRWVQKFTAYAGKHSGRALPFLYLAAASLASPNPEAAVPLLERSAALSGKNEWTALFFLAEQIERDDPPRAALYYHIVRTRRPDMGRIVNVRIQALTERLPSEPSVVGSSPK